MEDGKVMIDILYEDNHLLVVIKPANIPVQEDESKDVDLLTLLKKYIKDKYNKPGNVYLGLVHRLDRPVSGIMVFAKTSKSASRLSEQIRTNKFKKEYCAIVTGRLKKASDVCVDKLLKNTKTNIVKVDNAGKLSELKYQFLSYDSIHDLSLLKVNLVTGRSHQIRVQLSSRNIPIYGDQKYNKNAHVGQQIALFSNHLEFYHPITNVVMSFNVALPTCIPWNYFENN